MKSSSESKIPKRSAARDLYNTSALPDNSEYLDDLFEEGKKTARARQKAAANQAAPQPSNPSTSRSRTSETDPRPSTEQKKRPRVVEPDHNSQRSDPPALSGRYDYGIPRVYTSRHKKTERVLKSCFVILFLILACFTLKIILMDAPEISINAYNPRLAQIEGRIHRGTIFGSNGEVLAQSQFSMDGVEERSYPYGEYLSSVIGYSGTEKGGLEFSMNSWLLKAGSLEDSFRYWFLDQKINGCSIVTSLDPELSVLAYDLLGSKNGAVVIADATTGQILTLVSKPSYDPYTVLDNWDELQEDPDMPLFNRAVNGLYPPGSTFKIITSLAWIRSRLYNPDFQYTCTGIESFNDFQLPCFAGHVHGTIGIEQAFAHSCNTFFATIGTTIGAKQLNTVMNSLGFGKDRDFFFDATASKASLPSENCDLEELAISSIGQGTVTMTPLDLNRLTCAIANQGVFLEYSVVDRVIDPNGKTVRNSPSSEVENKQRTQLLSAKEAAWIESMMAACTDYGTAEEMAALGVPVYAKTGTAENESDQSHSWCTAYIEDYNGHKIVATVLVERSGGSLYAASLATEMFAFYLNRL